MKVSQLAIRGETPSEPLHFLGTTRSDRERSKQSWKCSWVPVAESLYFERLIHASSIHSDLGPSDLERVLFTVEKVAELPRNLPVDGAACEGNSIRRLRSYFS